MTTVSEIYGLFDECAEDLIGLPVAEAVRVVTTAELHVEVAGPDVHRVRDVQLGGVSVMADRHGVVDDVLRFETRAPGAGP